MAFRSRSDEYVSKVVLSNALTLLLPSPEESLLLRVCLSRAELAREAWSLWRSGRNLCDETVLGNSSVRKLQTLLFSAVQSHSLEIEKEGLTHLRTAYLKEELRSNAFRRICREVLLSLENEGLPAIVLKGTALAETFYPNPVMRHCHDIDILLPEPKLSTAECLMASRGFRVCTDPKPHGQLKLIHKSDLPLVFHSRLFGLPYYNTLLPEIVSRAETRSICGVSAKILAPTDCLLHVCGHASYSSKRSSLRWVVDAWFIIERHPDLDWDLLLDSTRRSNLSLPLSVMLTYMAESMYVAIPPAFLHSLYDAASKSQRIERELALHGTHLADRGGLKSLWHRIRNWRECAFVLQWLLFPSPRYLHFVNQTHPPWLLPLHYVYRPLQYLWFRLRCYFGLLLSKDEFCVNQGNEVFVKQRHSNPEAGSHNGQNPQ